MTFFPRLLTFPWFGRRPDLWIAGNVWHDLLAGLRSRGDGFRESGAFLLGPKEDTRRITSIVFYDEIDPAAFDTGIIVIDGSRMAELWRICRERGQAVLADVHTHGGGAGQSESDRMHPMIAERGHLAMILPRFAADPIRFREIGLYRYRGRFKWTRLKPSFLWPRFSIGGKTHA